MHTTNYRSTLILPSPDSPTTEAAIPPRAGSIAQIQHQLLIEHPYEMTSDDLLFEVFARRNDVPADAREDARADFFGKPQACLRASPLVKQFGWAIHHDEDERIALIPRESAECAALSQRVDIKSVNGMRSKRA